MTAPSQHFKPEPGGSADGLWSEIAAGNFAGRPALFRDRDGVIVEDTHYLGRAQEVRMLAGAGEAIARCNTLGIPVIVVSNQSGIARGLYDWSGFAAVQAAIVSALAETGARLDAVFACAHHADGKAPMNVADHPWRKPNPGMIVAAAERMKLDLAQSWIAGDRASDLAAGRAAGLAGGILISSRADAGERAAAMPLRSGEFAVDRVLARGCGRASAGARRVNATIVGDMNVIQTDIPGVLIIEPKLFGDARGFFLETFQAKRYADIGIAQPFVQDNMSRWVRGSLRGLHFQHPRAQAKLVTVLSGAVRDVVIDVRRHSASISRSISMTRTAASFLCRAASRMGLWCVPTARISSINAMSSIVRPMKRCCAGTIQRSASIGVSRTWASMIRSCRRATGEARRSRSWPASCCASSRCDAFWRHLSIRTSLFHQEKSDLHFGTGLTKSSLRHLSVGSSTR